MCKLKRFKDTSGFRCPTLYLYRLVQVVDDLDLAAVPGATAAMFPGAGAGAGAGAGTVLAKHPSDDRGERFDPVPAGLPRADVGGLRLGSLHAVWSFLWKAGKEVRLGRTGSGSGHGHVSNTHDDDDDNLGFRAQQQRRYMAPIVKYPDIDTT